MTRKRGNYTTGMSADRLAMADAARRMRDLGFTWGLIAQTIGASRGTAQNLVALSRALQDDPSLDPGETYTRLTMPKARA